MSRQVAKQTGASLLEVMIALVVFGIGMIGTAALMATSIRDNNSAYLRTQAVFLANNMAERIRANLDGADEGEYDAIALGSSGGTAADCDWDAPCDFDALAANDEFEWKRMINQSLPNGQGSVTAQNTDPEVFLITVQWIEAATDDGNTAGTQTVVLATHP